ncbi:MFS transporter [Serinibacter salmoneus]|uniref:Sugar transport protein n=1 Tax=Serinibacter salmoneus TaxID=556530 RepID=A0A2A9D0J8_9MICO|nr:MFS transporter [Serinibacter salmoneus]PFG19472.1 sugar transport protein [Serinibacter salmoneus]
MSTSARSIQSYLDETPQWPDGTRLVQAPMTGMQQLIFALASAGKLFEGLVVFMNGVALPLVTLDFSLTTTQQGMVTAAPLFGILLGAIALGNLSDRFGRKQVFIAEMLAFTVFLVGLALAPTFPVMLLCLIGTGVALGSDYPVAHLMLSETMSSRARSRTVLGAFAFQAVGAVVGSIIAVVILRLMPGDASSWRVMFAVAILPALAVSTGRFFVVQSPHWALTKGHSVLAHEALTRLLARSPAYPERVVIKAPKKPKGKHKATFADLFRKKKARRATILASVPWFLQDLGTYGIGIFTPVIVATTFGSGAAQTDTDDHSVAAVVASSLEGAEAAVFIDAFLVIGILVAIRYVDRVGSIRLQIWGFLGCGLGLGIAALSGAFVGAPQTALIFLGFIVFNFATNAGPNSQTYLLAGEVFPTKIRGTGAGFAAAFAKIGAVMTSFLFPILLAAIGQTALLLILIATSALGAWVTHRFQIRTTGVNLEEMQFEDPEQTGSAGALAQPAR